MSENPVLGFSHIIPKLVPEFFLVVLLIQLDPVRLLYLHVELLACAHEVAVDPVGDFIVRSVFGMLVDHDPLFTLQVHGLLDRQLSKDVLVNVDDLTALENLGSIHDPRLNLDRHCFDADVPLLEGFLSLKGICHLLDFRDFFVRADVGPLKSLSHARAAPHAF